MKQLLFINFSDDRDDILRYRFASNSDEYPDLLKDIIDVYEFVNTKILKYDVDGINDLMSTSKKLEIYHQFFQIEVYDNVSNKYININRHIDDANFVASLSDRISTMNRIRILINDVCKANKKQTLAINGRRFSATDAMSLYYTSQGVQYVTSVSIEEVHEQDAIDIDGSTGLKYWDSAIVLIKYLEIHMDDYFAYKSYSNVLEIGAGTGIVGISCYRLLQLFMHQQTQVFPVDMTITDITYSMPNLHKNVLRNKHDADIACVNMRDAVLDWNEPSIVTPYMSVATDTPLNSNFDLILASDVMWLEHLVPSLVQTLVYYSKIHTENGLRYKPPLIILAHQVTSSYACNDIWGSAVVVYKSCRREHCVLMNCSSPC